VRREPHPGRLFLAFAGWLALLVLILWINQGGNVLVSFVCSVAVAHAIPVRE